MTAAAASGWLLAVAGLAALAATCFALAVRSGRWGVWLAGYLFAVLAFAAALISNDRARQANTTAPSAPTVQPSPDYGVLPRSDGRDTDEAT